MTLISILLPARNAEATLDEALESLAAQTHREWELIAVDDGSQDRTPALLERWAQREARVRVLSTDLTPSPFPAREGEPDEGRPPLASAAGYPPEVGRGSAAGQGTRPDLTPSPFPAREGEPSDQGERSAVRERVIDLSPPSPSRGGAGGGVPHGIVPALNLALAAAHGPVIARMDADDISLPTRLERQLTLLADGGADVIGCQVHYFPDEAVAGGARRYEAWLNSLVTPEEHARDLFIECPLAHPTLVLPRALLEAAGGYRARGWPEDYDLVLRLWRRGARLAKVPEPLFLWREAPGRTSRTHPDYLAEAFRRCKAYHLRRSYLAGSRPVLMWGAGPFGKLLTRELMAEGVPLRGFVDLSPRRIGQVIYGAPVLSQPEAFRLQGEAFGIAAVGQAGARDEIRAAMAAAGWIETIDFCCAA